MRTVIAANGIAHIMLFCTLTMFGYLFDLSMIKLTLKVPVTTIDALAHFETG